MGAIWEKYKKEGENIVKKSRRRLRLSRNFRFALSTLVAIVGVIAVLYVGGYLFFIGGVSDLVEEVNALNVKETVDGGHVAIGILRIIFAPFISYVIGAVFWMIWVTTAD